MVWKNKVLVALFAAGLMAYSSLSHALGELENVTLHVVIYPSNAPFAFIEEDITHPQGVDVDIVYELQRRLFFSLDENRIFPLRRDDCFARLDNGTADLMIGAISYTPQRATKYDFTPPYYQTCLTSIFSRRFHPEIKSVEDLKGLQVGVERGSTAADFMRNVGANLKIMDNITLALFQVSTGTLDAFIYDRPVLMDFADALKTLDMTVINDVFGENDTIYAFAMPKNSEYTAVINETMQAMIDDGTISAILKKWKAETLTEFKARIGKAD